MPNSSMAALDETAMSLKTQKPSPLSRKAWCVPPGSAHTPLDECIFAKHHGRAFSFPGHGIDSTKRHELSHQLCLL